MCKCHFDLISESCKPSQFCSFQTFTFLFVNKQESQEAKAASNAENVTAETTTRKSRYDIMQFSSMCFSIHATNHISRVAWFYDVELHFPTWGDSHLGGFNF